MPIVLKYILGVVLGGGAGFLYYRLIGCSTGACPITSNPIITIILGVLLGLLVARG